MDDETETKIVVGGGPYTDEENEGSKDLSLNENEKGSRDLSLDESGEGSRDPSLHENEEGSRDSSIPESEGSDESETSFEDSSVHEEENLANTNPEFAARLSKLQNLRQKMHQIEVVNRKDIIQEQESHSIPPSLLQKMENRKQKEKELEEYGDKHERYQNLKYSIQDVEAWESSKSRKRSRVNTGFIDFHQASFKKYKRMLNQLQPDLTNYETQKQLAEMNGESEAFYGHAPPSSSMYKVGKEDVDRLVQDLNKQVDIRNKSSRRRAYDANEDVTYINDKNRNFNKKISRAFDKYTKEIKDSLERGTAL